MGYGEPTNPQFIYPYRMSSATATVIPWFVSESNHVVIVCIERRDEPFKDRAALPGGFQETGKEDLEQTAKRELFEETGMSVSGLDLQLVAVQSKPDRDERGVIIDHVYSVFITSDNLFRCKPGDDAKSLRLIEISKEWNRNNNFEKDLNATFAFDHGDSIFKFLLSRKYEVKLNG